MISKISFASIVGILSGFAIATKIMAQEEPTTRPLDPTPPLELPTPLQSEEDTPQIQTPPPPESQTPDPNLAPLPAQSFVVEKIEVLGATVLQEEIEAEIKQVLEKKILTLDDLLTLRSVITKLYIDNGYITSGAFVPNNQDLNDGIVQIQVVEGAIEDIQITGSKRIRPSYIRSRISRGTDAPLNREKLEQSLQLLQLNPLLNRVNAELTAGRNPGLSILQLEVDPARAFHAGVTFDNTRSPSTGSLQGSLNISHDNVLGFGDRFSGGYAITEGLNLFNLGYTFPINAKDGSIGVSFSRADSNIITEDAEDLDIRSEFESLTFTVEQPILKKPNREFKLGLAFDLRQSLSFLEGELSSISAGPQDGVSQTRVLRFSQDWLQRSRSSVLAARSQFSLGLNAFDATINDEGPSADFFAWLGQVQYVRQLPWRSLLVSRLSSQISPDPLLSLERLGIGGADTVRGYVRNQILTDNGVLGSIEMRIPVTRNPNTLQLSPFIDAGTGWNNFTITPDVATLVGIGLGVRWQPIDDLSVNLDYGIPLIEVETQSNSLQESGLFFSVRYQPF